MSIDILSVQVLRGVMMGLLSLAALFFFFGHHLFGQPMRRSEHLGAEFHPSPLRPWMGVLAVYLALGYLFGLLVDVLPTNQHSWWVEISFLLDVLVVPLCVVIAAKILRLDYMSWSRVVLNFVPPVLLLVLHIFVDSNAIMYVSLVYTALYLLVALSFMVYYGRRYEAHLEDQYSSTYGRSVRWMLAVPVLASLQIGAFLLRSWYHELVAMQVAYYLLSMVNLCFIFTRVYRMILTDEDSVPVDTLTDTPEPELTLEETADDSLRNREFLDLLKARCEDTLLYTREDLTRDELAHILRMSHSTFTLRLRSARNQTFYEYINDLRIERAAQLLTQGELTATQIAFDVGYQYYSTFVRAFRNRYNCLPSEYKSAEPIA